MQDQQDILGLPSGTAFPVTPNDRLILTVTNGDAQDTITLNYVIRREDGLHFDGVSFVCPSNAAGGVATRIVVPLTDGFLVGATISSSAAHQIGTVYARLILARFINNNLIQDYAVLVRDHIGAQYQPSWPPTGDRGYSPLREAVRNQILTVPAAGADVSYIVPLFQRLKVIGVRIQIVTDANVANRYIVFAFSQNGAEIVHLNSSIPTPAGTTKDYFFLAGYPRTDNFIPGQVIEPLPTGIMLASGDVVITGVSGLQAGDQISRFNVSCLFTTTA